MQQLTGLDVSYLYLDAPNQPVHIVCLFIFDAGSGKEKFNFKAYRELMASRLHVSRIFRQRLVETPLHLDYPYWIEDPDFNLDFHIHRMALPKPGGWEELKDLYRHILVLPLDRSRPLWNMYLVEGLDSIKGISPDSFAMIMKVHHVAIDGISGAHILNNILDPTITPRKLQAPVWSPDSMPDEIELLKKSMVNTIKRPLQVKKLISQVKQGGINLIGRAFSGKIQHASIPFDVPMTRFNGAISSHRAWDSISCSLAEVKAIGKAADSKITVNDVVLTLCAGALRRYLADKNELPSHPLIALVPVSIRSTQETMSMGNRISTMLIKLATTEKYPEKRLEMSHKYANSAKAVFAGFDDEMLADSLEALPYLLGGAAALLYRKTQKKNWPQLFNLVITNVPGPFNPLYANGIPLKSVYLSGPIIDGNGLFIGIFSYAGLLTINVNVCKNMMPDVEVFTNYLKESLRELR